MKIVRNNFKSHQLIMFQDRLIEATETWLSSDLNIKPGENSTVIAVHPFAQQIVARISALVFAGEEVGKNEEFIHALATYASRMFTAGYVFVMFPRFVAEYVTRHFLTVGPNITTTMKHVEPLVTEIKRREEIEGPTNPTNFMHMMLHTPDASDAPQTPAETAFWMKDIALASIHTTSLFLSFALHDMSDRPDIQDLLREEVNGVKTKDGAITPQAVSQLPLMDSFLRDPSDMEAISSDSVIRQ